MEEKAFTKENFENDVIRSDKPVVVDFWAPWCGPCRMMGPVIAKLAEEADGRFYVGKINVDDEEELAKRYGVMSIPTIKIFKNGDVAASATGTRSKEQILEMLNN